MIALERGVSSICNNRTRLSRDLTYVCAKDDLTFEKRKQWYQDLMSFTGFSQEAGSDIQFK